MRIEQIGSDNRYCPLCIEVARPCASHWCPFRPYVVIRTQKPVAVLRQINRASVTEASGGTLTIVPSFPGTFFIPSATWWTLCVRSYFSGGALLGSSCPPGGAWHRGGGLAPA